ncbi:secretin N-terminal domain-containing protein [Thermomonas fusca]|uniref:secretin N-terminal domain-containing protein n=1 Tax=Thermomonas fusca TaxID=215690 RepID=UPI00042A2123|nr:secretin N-terminal domain-containing protein [Thermomonas fusca]
MRVIALAAVVGVLAACAARPPELPRPLRAPKADAPTGEVLGDAASGRTHPQIERGPEPVRREQAAQQPERAQSRIPPMQRSEPVAIALDGVPLETFINIVYGMELGLPVQIDQSLRGRPELLSLSLAKPMPPEQAFRVAEEVLRSYNVRIDELGGVLRFMPVDQRTSEVSPLLQTRSLPDVPAGQRTVFVSMPLQYRRPGAVIPQAKELFNGKSVTFNPLIEANAVLISGPGTDVRAAMQALDALDQAVLRDKYSLRINPLYLPADLLAKELREVLAGQGIAVYSGGGEPGALTFVPVNSANALIVFANSQQALDTVAEWVARLDQPSDAAGSGGMYVYAARHTTVDTMLPVLQALAGGAGASAGNAGASGVAGTGSSTGETARGARQGNAVTAVSGFGGQLAADTVRNMIVFQGDAQSWRALQGVLARLDQPARQVLIEVTVAEVTLTDELTHGVEWALRNISVEGMSGPLTALADNATAGGLRWAALSSSGQVRATLNLFAKDSRVTILSTPRILVKSGEAASIDVGTEVPIITSQATAPDLPNNGNQSSILQSVQYRKTGTLLDIEAVVHSGQRVDLKISQEVSEAVQTDTSEISSPSILSRSLRTVLSLADGQSTLLGGLISSSRADGKSKVPLLGDIPLLGRAFQNRTKSSVRTELLLLITPYVLEDSTQVEEVTRAVRERFGRVERSWPGRPDGAPAPLQPREPLPVPPAKPSPDPQPSTEAPINPPVEAQSPAAESQQPGATRPA